MKEFHLKRKIKSNPLAFSWKEMEKWRVKWKGEKWAEKGSYKNLRCKTYDWARVVSKKEKHVMNETETKLKTLWKYEAVVNEPTEKITANMKRHFPQNKSMVTKLLATEASTYGISES